MKKIYCAGPFVFLMPEDRQKTQCWLQRKLLEQRLEPLFPWNEEGRDVSKIREINLIHIEESAGVLADLRPFRGTEPDAGTVYECAWASCVGIPLAAYAGGKTYKESVTDILTTGPEENYRLIEDFGLHCNLMLGSDVCSTASEAIRSLAIRIHSQARHAA